MKKWYLYTGISLLIFSTISRAGTMGTCESCPLQSSGVFMGLGGSYNPASHLNQHIDIIEQSDLFSGIPPTYLANANGTSNAYHNTKATFGPEAQAGYFRHFANINQFWGVKLMYHYIGASFKEFNINIPLNGTLNNPFGMPPVTPFNGYFFIPNARTTLNDEIDLLAFIGTAFTSKSQVYAGIGPSLFRTQTKLNNAYGFVNPGGGATPFFVLVNSESFATDKWLMGGALQAGITHFISPTVFLDFNYTYAIISGNTNNNLSPYSSAEQTVTYNGTMYTYVHSSMNTQAISITINKVFPA